MSTLKAGGGRGECIGACLSLRLAHRTSGRTAQARIFWSGRQTGTQELAHTQQSKKTTRGAGVLPAARHHQPLPLRHRAVVRPGARDTGRFKFQQLATRSAIAPTVRACGRNPTHRRRRGVASSAQPTAHPGAQARQSIRRPPSVMYCPIAPVHCISMILYTNQPRAGAPGCS
jgi:hypothetical protein